MTTREKEIILGLLAIVVLAALVVFFTRSESPEAGPGAENAQNDLSEDDQVKAADKNDILLAFPQDIPIEISAEVRESYVFTPAGSTENQSTLEYVSRRSVEDNAGAFSSFFADRGFELTNEVAEEGLHFFYTTKDGNDLSVLIDGTKGAVQITVSYLER